MHTKGKSATFSQESEALGLMTTYTTPVIPGVSIFQPSFNNKNMHDCMVKNIRLQIARVIAG